MSVLDVCVSRDCILIGVDTEVRDQNGVVVGQMPKVIPLPHFSAAMAGCGDGRFSNLVFRTCADPRGSFDDLLGLMPALLKNLWPLYADHERTCGRGGHGEFLNEQAIVLAGWSDGEQTMKAVHYEQVNPDLGFIQSPIQGHCLRPWRARPELEVLGVPTSPEALEQLVRAQVGLIRREEPEKAGGGAVVIASLTRRSVTTLLSRL